MLKKNIGHLSKGYRQRVGLAQAMIHDPPILILDEPTSGLDPHQIIEIRELIKELGKTKTILFSSHILQEISAIRKPDYHHQGGADRSPTGRPRTSRRRAAGGSVYRVSIQGPAEAVQLKLSGVSGVQSAKLVEQEGGFGQYLIRVSDGKDLGPEIFRTAKVSGWTLSRLDEVSRSLEEVYLQLTEKK